MLCNRGIYHKGWTAVTRHGIPWHVTGTSGRLADDVWELYGTTDWTQAHDLAAELPDKLQELKRLFEIEATKYNVFPLDDRRAERPNPELAGRPQVVSGTTQLLFGGMHRLQENAVINIKNHSHSVTAEIDVPEAGAQGGDFGGWSLYAHQGRLRYAYNFVGVLRSYVSADTQLPAGTHQARMEFAYDGGGIGKGGTVTLYVDSEQVGQGRVERTHKFFSPWTRPPTSAATPAPPSPRTTAPATTTSTARSTGSRSTSTRPPKTSTTSSTRRSGSSWQWPSSRPSAGRLSESRCVSSVPGPTADTWRRG
jgi:hypothetical protein